LVEGISVVSEWISVEDRLPMHRMVLGWDGEHQFCMMIGGKLSVYYGDSNGWVEPEFAITHWMPLPEPPK